MHVTGRVIHGSGEGKKLGFPTANIALDQEIFLNFGVYACQFFVKSTIYDGILHYGPRFVFAKGKPVFEVHIFNFDEIIYDELTEIYIHDFIRPTLNFPSPDDMVKEIFEDCKKAKQILARFHENQHLNETV